MKNGNGYTEEEKEAAKSISLTSLAAQMGYTPVRIGKCHTLKEMDSIRIYNDRTWYRWSGNGNRNGGSQIDFLLEFGNSALTVPEAIHELLNMAGLSYARPLEKDITRAEKDSGDRHMVLPEKAENYKRLYAYLIKQRGLSMEVINYFVKDIQILYEEKEHHNIVFLGKDSSGNVRFATKRGTGDIYGHIFKGDVRGNDKNYGVNIVNQKSDEVKVFEAAIDLMSYMDLTGDYESNKLVLGMVEDNPLRTFLAEHQNIKKIGFFLDNDKAAMDKIAGTEEVRDISGRVVHPAKQGYIDRYAAQGYEVYARPAPMIGGVKDYNNYLKYMKDNEPSEVAVLNVYRQRQISR